MAQHLTPKQAMFVIEYLKDLNGTQAAIRAGYSEDTAQQIASENLLKPLIKEAIQEQMDARATRTLITGDKVLSGMYEVMQRCMQGKPVLVKDIEGKFVENGIWDFDASGANKALENLARHLKLLTDKSEIGNADGSNFEFPIMQRVYVGKPED